MPGNFQWATSIIIIIIIVSTVNPTSVDFKTECKNVNFYLTNRVFPNKSAEAYAFQGVDKKIIVNVVFSSRRNPYVIARARPRLVRSLFLSGSPAIIAE